MTAAHVLEQLDCVQFHSCKRQGSPTGRPKFHSSIDKPGKNGFLKISVLSFEQQLLTCLTGLLLNLCMNHEPELANPTLAKARIVDPVQGSMGHLIFCMESVSKLPYVISMKYFYLQKLNKVESKKWEATPFHQAQNDKQK